MTIIGLNVCNVYFTPAELKKMENGSPALSFIGKTYDTMPQKGEPFVEVIKETKSGETYKRIFNLLK